MFVCTRMVYVQFEMASSFDIVFYGFNFVPTNLSSMLETDARIPEKISHTTSALNLAHHVCTLQKKKKKKKKDRIYIAQTDG